MGRCLLVGRQATWQGGLVGEVRVCVCVCVCVWVPRGVCEVCVSVVCV